MIKYHRLHGLLAVFPTCRDGMYAPLAYLAAHTALQAPLMLALAAATLGVPGYAVFTSHQW